MTQENRNRELENDFIGGQLGPLFFPLYVSIYFIENPDMPKMKKGFYLESWSMILHRPGLEVIKLFSCSTQLSTKFPLLIKTKIPTNEEVSCFKSLICCTFHANKCC